MPLFGLNVEKLEAKQDVDGLVKALENKDSQVRQKAAIALCRIGDSRAVLPLVTVVTDREYSVRYAAVLALRKFGDSRAVDALITALHDTSEELRNLAAMALGSIQDDRAVEPLIAALQDQGYFGVVRRSAAKSLGQIKDSRAFAPLVTAMEAGNLEAIDALCEIGDPRAVEHLTRALENELIRPSAAKALKCFPMELTVQALKPMLFHGNISVVQTVATILSDLGWQPEPDDEFRAAYSAAKQDWPACIEIGEPAVEPIRRLLISLINVPTAGIDALMMIGSTRAAEALMEVWKQQVGYFGNNSASAQAIVQTLVRIGAPAVEPLCSALNETHLCKDAAEALGNIGDERAVKDLLAATVVDNRASADALVKIGQPSVPALYDALTNPDRRLHFDAAGILDRLNWQPDLSEAAAAYWAAKRNWQKCIELGQLAVNPLIAVLMEGMWISETDTIIALSQALDGLQTLSDSLSAAKALGEIGDRRAVGPLTLALNHKDSNIRNAAVIALRKIGDTQTA